MADVGRLAGVSAQTVSRFFTNTGYVGDEARTRIAAAVRELGYVQNLTARNLRAERTNTVGVLSMGALNYGAAGVLTGLALAAREEDVTLIVTQLDVDFENSRTWEQDARNALDHLRSFSVDGIVLATPIPESDALVAAWQASIPIVVVSERPTFEEASVGAHSYAAGIAATSHLIDLGHVEIIHVAGPRTRNEALEREAGYRDAMTGAGLVPRVVSGATDWSPASGARACADVDPSTFTGVFASNDEIALGFMSAMEGRGRRAPVDYSIVGVDDMPMSSYFSPPLTTMRIDFELLGRATFSMVRQEILTGTVEHHVAIEPELVVRDSTAAPSRT